MHEHRLCDRREEKDSLFPQCSYFYLCSWSVVKLLPYGPGHPGKLSHLLLGFEQAVVSTLQVL